jgi:hypothetical protein
LRSAARPSGGLSVELNIRLDERPPRPSSQARQLVAVDSDRRPAAYTWTESADGFVEVVGVGVYGFRDRSGVVDAFPADDVGAEAVVHAYESTALPLGLQGVHGYEAVHASAILVEGRVVAFSAPSEVGKSTTAGGLARRGYVQWSDDALALAAAPNAIESVSLPFRDSSGSAGQTAPPWQRAPVAAVFLLERWAPRAVGGRGAEISRLTPARAFAALLPNVYCFRPHTRERGQRMMKSYLELVAQVPVYRVRFLPRLDRLGELLDALEELFPPPRSTPQRR